MAGAARVGDAAPDGPPSLARAILDVPSPLIAGRAVLEILHPTSGELVHAEMAIVRIESLPPGGI